MEEEREEREEKEDKRGCRRGCLAGCLVVILLVVVAVVAIYLNRERLTKFMFNKITEGMLTTATEDVDKEKIKELMTEVREALKEGKFDPEKMQEAGRELRKDSADGKLQKEEVDKLIKMFREAIEEKD